METQGRNEKNISESSIFKGILGKAEEYAKKPIRVKELLNDAYKKASDKKDFGSIAHEVWENLQVLSRMIKAAVTGEYHGIPTSTIIGGIAVFIYFLTQIDFVPDFIPVIGLLDDVSLMAWFMTSIKTEMEHFLGWEAGEHAEVVGSTTGSQNTDPSFNTPKAEHISTTSAGRSGDQNQHRTSDAHKATSGHQPNMQGSAGATASAPNQTDGEVLHFTDHTVAGLGKHSDKETPRATSSGSGEPSARAATTDSTRVPSSNRNDTDTGGNVR